MNQLAYQVVNEAVGEARREPDKSSEPKRGRAGGLKGGKARAKKLSPRKRSEIARIAARARWRKGGGDD